MLQDMDDLLTLPAAIGSYIPKQLLKNVDFDKCSIGDELEYVQNVLDNSNDSLRMYGSAESLLQRLKVYMKFPLSRKMFPRGLGGYCYTIPNIYHTLKKEVLYCKQDLLFHLQSCLYTELRLYENAQKLKFAELIEYMKKHEERLGGCYEFVKYDYDVIEDIEISLSCYESMHVVSKNGKVTAVREPRVTHYIEEEDFVEIFDNLISKYPCFFLPNSETKNKNATAVVRIFDDGGFKFVMESELFAAINLKNPNQKPLKCMDVEGHYRTIDYKHVLERYRDQITGIDFIYHLIPLGLHAAVPIATPTGDHCILAVDAYMDIITETFFTGVFQKITQNMSHMIPKFFVILREYFPSNIKYRYFINLKLFQKLREELEEFWKPIEDKPMKRIRNVGPQGFTVDDLIKELKYTGYTKIFPEITADARVAYTDYFHSLKPSEMKTSDMFAAVQVALANVLTNRYPQIDEFVYRQKVCLHDRIKSCDDCLEAFVEAEARIEDEIKAESEQASSSVTATTSDVVKEEEDAEESNPESVTNEAPSIVKTDHASLKNSVESSLVEAETKPVPAISEPEVPERDTALTDSNSHICKKCMETSNEVRKEVDETYRKMMSQVKEHNEQLELAQKALEEKEQKFEELEKAVREELSKAVMTVNKEKDNIEALRLELMERTGSILDELDVKSSKIQELELKNSKLTEEKNQEIEKLKKQQALAAKEHKKEMEQLKRNASESADEIKKLTAAIAEKEAAENLLKRSNKGLLEKLQNAESRLKEVTHRRAHLETEVAEKNRTILELQKTAEKQVSEQEKTKREHETRISRILAACNEVLPPEPIPEEKPDTECLICLSEMKPNQKTLKCDHCRKIMHLKCAADWHKVKRSCAHCRREQLDPNEFPSLQ